MGLHIFKPGSPTGPKRTYRGQVQKGLQGWHQKLEGGGLRMGPAPTPFPPIL